VAPYGVSDAFENRGSLSHGLSADEVEVSLDSQCGAPFKWGTDLGAGAQNCAAALNGAANAAAAAVNAPTVVSKGVRRNMLAPKLLE
jgi:hypothetical protein